MLQMIEPTGMRNVYEPTFDASPEPISLKYTSQPRAMTNTEMNSVSYKKAAVQRTSDQLSTVEL